MGVVETIPKIGASVVSRVGKLRREEGLINNYRGKCEISKINSSTIDSLTTAEMAEG